MLKIKFKATKGTNTSRIKHWTSIQKENDGKAVMFTVYDGNTVIFRCDEKHILKVKQA